MVASTKRTAKVKRVKPKQTGVKSAAAGTSTKRAPLTCPNCRVALRANGEIELREGGSGGGTNFLFGDFTAIAEGLWLLKRYVCPRCRVVTLREPR